MEKVSSFVSATYRIVVLVLMGSGLAMHPERLVQMSTRIPEGPLRQSAFSYIGFQPESGIVMSDRLPSAERHLTNALYRDTR